MRPRQPARIPWQALSPQVGNIGRVRRRILSRGAVFVEALVAVMVVLVAMAAVAQLVAFSSRQRREDEHFRTATQEIENVMERLYALPWNELNSDMAAAIDVSPSVSERLDGSTLQVAVDVVDDAIPTKRVRVQVSWINRAGERVEPIQLTAWKHNPERTP